MTTGRVPRFPASDLSDDASRAPDTHPELEPVLAAGSGDNPTVTDRDYFDDQAGPRWRDHDDRIAALERGEKRRSRKRTWGERVLAFLLGSGLTAAVWWQGRTERAADERATDRERKDERKWLVESVRVLLDRDAKREGQIEMLRERLRYYPVHGPDTGDTP